MFLKSHRPLLSLLGLFDVTLGLLAAVNSFADANRLTYLDENDPFYVRLNFPKLTTPQWVGEPGVEAVVILAIDDMREPHKYEAFLRPILERLKQVEGRAPVSIMCNALDPQHPQLQAWLKEGLSLEVHTLTHPCPLLARSNFTAAADTYHGCVDLLNRIPDNQPVAFRMPCCDSMNSPSPRFYAEVFNRTSSAGKFLTIDSSVMNITTPKDKSLPRVLTVDADGREKFRKYLPAVTNAISKVSMGSFVTTIEDYPYPYVIGKLCWEFPCVLPSDWEAQNIHGTNNPVTVADWKAALDVTVMKQGVFTMIFHPHGWIRNDQIVELIEYAVTKYGKRVKFLNFREAQERLNKNLLAGQPLRAVNGQDNGVRLVDLNNDGFLDVAIGNGLMKKTRVWQPKESHWLEASFPTTLDAGVKFGVVRADSHATILVNSAVKGAWHFDGEKWIEDKSLLTGLEIGGKPINTSENGRDRGVRFRDVDNDGRCELIVGNESQNAVFAWSPEGSRWKQLPFALPKGVAIVDENGQDAGLRFVDFNEDGFADVIFSNDKIFSLHLFVSENKPGLAWEVGWPRKVRAGKQGNPDAIPMIVRAGTNRNNGVWFHSRHLWVQNEETDRLPDKVDRRSYETLLAFDAPPPKAPEESLKEIEVPPGFKVELVAHEPLVRDPIAFEWGADGKLWVVEMGDYPVGVDGHGKSGGIVRFLEDTDGDGRYDKSTVFLEGLNFPNGVTPWRKGVIVSAAPRIIYAEDTNGDGKADVREVLFTGFREGNQQHRVNGFDYGLDNWIYGANGDSGGEIHSVATGKSFNLRGRDFRFKPDGGSFETVEGQTQFGRHRDDWGNWFGNNNPTWLWHYFLPDHYLSRNSHLAVRSTMHYLANYPHNTAAFAISRPMQRFNFPDMVNTVTSANSPTPYRDELFGPEFATSVFASEPANNLIHREVLEPDGVTFKSHRARGEEEREFLASRDNWFRPTMLKTGPDGALYIADMYRLVIEHPEYALPGMDKQIDVRAGHDKGRIYRVFPADAKLRKIPRLDQLKPADLVTAMDSPNGWQRDTAQRLLVQAADKSAVKLLQQLLGSSARPKTRLQALCTLDGLGAVTPEILVKGLNDSHPAVREHAVRLSEPFMKKNPSLTPALSLSERERENRATRSAEPKGGELLREAEKGHPRPRRGGEGQGEGFNSFSSLADALLNLVDDPAIRVRYQLAFGLGEWNDPRAGRALARLAIKDADNSEMQIAVMSSAVPHVGNMIDALLAEAGQRATPLELLDKLFGLAVVASDEKSLAKTLARVTQPIDGKHPAWQLAALAGCLDAFERRAGSLKAFQSGSGAELRQTIDRFDVVFNEARRIIGNPTANDTESRLAIRILGRGLNQQEQDIDRLVTFLQPQVEGDLQSAALDSLKRANSPHVADALLSGWKAHSPALRIEVLNILLSRPERTRKLLEAVEEKRILPSELGTVHQQKLLTHANDEIRKRAAKLLSATNTDRQKIIKDFAAVNELKGDAGKGADLFQKNCAVCHRFNGVGNSIGADLGSVGDKSVPAMLVSILDPNRAVEARYLSYTALTKSDREISGVIAAETPNSITLRTAGGTEEVVLRSDLKELRGSSLSLMPEGFEKTLTPQALADLIAYIASGEQKR
ncbi:MAG: VCBS repeat-containing protein [Verrucomicrobia bacterium]|nr:VCBS repeat-containing protein [Verrucomicrobiota bacterium]